MTPSACHAVSATHGRITPHRGARLIPVSCAASHSLHALPDSTLAFVPHLGLELRGRLRLRLLQLFFCHARDRLLPPRHGEFCADRTKTDGCLALGDLQHERVNPPCG